MRLYRLLLHLYPAWFRAEYEEELCAVFAARRVRENARVLWTSTVIDIVANAVLVHGDVLWQDLRWTVRNLRQSSGFALTHGMTSLLFGVEPSGHLIYAAASLALVMTIAGSLRPALRAASIDPVITIRTE